MFKIVLWGIGEGYNEFIRFRGYETVNVVAIVDREKRYKYLDGIPVIHPIDIISGDVEFDYIVISVIEDAIFREIVEEAIILGIPRDIILPLRIFKIPFFNFDEYVSIKNSKISILSDYCFAGYIYHKFGMQFTTPTIKMYSDNPNYYRFISNLEKYMNTSMVEVENIVDDPSPGGYAYPRGRLDDVEWTFNHDVIYETAKERWEKGVSRFNWNNYMVIMTIESEEYAYKFNSLPIKKKIGFYYKDLGLDSVVYIPEWNSPKIRARFAYSFSSYVNRVAKETEGVRAINWMKALQADVDFRRIGSK